MRNGITDNGIHDIREALKRQTDLNRRMLATYAANGIAIVPFVGAGIPMAYGANNWGGIIQDMANYFMYLDESFKDDYLKVQENLKKNNYPEAANILKKYDSDNYKNYLIDIAAKLSRIRFNNIALSHRYLIDITDKLVITTNFDFCIESIFLSKKKPVVVKTASELGINNEDYHNPNSITLIKLHGDFNHFDDLVFTSEDYKKEYYNTENEIDHSKKLPLLLKSIALTNVILFIGCSLENDQTIQVLKKLRESFKKLELFAIVEAPSLLSTDDINPSQIRKDLYEKQNHFREANINPIWHSHGSYNEIDIHLKVILSSKKEHQLLKNSRTKALSVTQPSFIASDIVQEAIGSNSVIRISCTTREYVDYCSKLTFHNDISVVVWSMNGCPLDSHRYLHENQIEAEQDLIFTNEIPTNNKKRLIIFKDFDEAGNYFKTKASIESDSCIEEKRKYKFEILNKNNLLFTTRELLKNSNENLGDSELFEFGYSRFSNSPDASILYCSQFSTDDFRNGDKHYKEFLMFKPGSIVPDSVGWDKNTVGSLQELHELVIIINSDHMNSQDYQNKLQQVGIFTSLEKMVQILSKNQKEDL